MRTSFGKYLLYTCFSLAYVLVSQTATAQLKKPRVYLVDAGMNATLYTTYLQFSSESEGYDYKFTLADEEIYDQLAKQIPPDKLDYVIAYSQRQNYPPDMQKPGAANSLVIQNNAVLYYMARFTHRKGNFILVEFPAAENANNAGLSEDQRPKTDIYFVTTGFKSDITPYKSKYTKAERKAIDDIRNNFDAFYNNTDRYIDTSQYFKTTVPVPHYTREQYITHRATPSAADEKKLALLKERDKLTTEIVETERAIVELYNQKRYAELLTAFPIWECESLNIESKKDRPAGDLLGPIPMLMTIRIKMHLTKGGNGVDLLSDEIISAQEGYGSPKAEEFFTTVQHFSIAPGNPTLKNGDYKNNRVTYIKNFDKPPYDYFKPVVSQVMNDFVVPAFDIILKGDHSVFLKFTTEHLGTNEFYPESVSATMSRLKVVEKQLAGLN